RQGRGRNSGPQGPQGVLPEMAILRWVVRSRRLFALATAAAAFACLADRSLRPVLSVDGERLPPASFLPSLPDSLPGPGRAGIIGVMIDSVTGRPVHDR